MKFKLIIDPSKEEEVVVTAHAESPLTQRIQALAAETEEFRRLLAFREDDMVMLDMEDIVCFTVQDGKTYAVDTKNVHYRLKQRLYELESRLPGHYIRINKSAIANEKHILRFRAGFSGAVDAVFRGGYSDYVSRRCFAMIKRRYEQ